MSDPPNPRRARPAATAGDAELLDRVRHGDRAALGALYDAEGGYAYRLAHHLLGTEDEACEAVEAAFAGLHQQTETDPPRRARVLLLDAVHRHATSTLRHRQLLDRAQLPPGAPHLERGAVEQRQAVAYCVLAGLKVHEAAEILQLDRGTIHRRLHAALRSLADERAGAARSRSASAESREAETHGARPSEQSATLRESMLVGDGAVDGAVHRGDGAPPSRDSRFRRSPSEADTIYERADSREVAMTKIMKCATCGEPTPVPTCRSCGAELIAAAPDPSSEREVTDRDQTASDRDQTSSDGDQTTSDHDQSSADRDQAGSDSDQRSSDDDQDAADDDLAAGGDQATHDRTTRERDEATDDRADVSEDRDQTAEARQATAADRDRAAALRDRGAQRRDALASLRDAPDDARATRDDLAMRAESDRVRAASDREHAAEDRARAAADRSLAARERAEAVQARTDATHALEFAATDELTGARSRRTGLDDLQHEVIRAQRTRRRLVLAFVDVDGLKEVNDSDGHLAGDALLRLVGETLHAHLRPYDVIVRYGGDEFVCALPDLGPAEAGARFELIAAILREPDEAHSITFGLAELDPAADNLDELIARADDDLLEKRRARSSSD